MTNVEVKSRLRIIGLVSALILGMTALLCGYLLFKNGGRGIAVSGQPILITLLEPINKATNATSVRLNFTNRTGIPVLINPRAVITATNGAPATNYNVLPMFIGLDGPGSSSTHLILDGGAGEVVELAPINVAGTFQIEFVCFPQREGIEGLLDKGRDQWRGFKDGSQHQSFMGGSFILASPPLETE